MRTTHWYFSYICGAPSSVFGKLNFFNSKGYQNLLVGFINLMEENLPPGFRFHPTDEELITCYLTRKVSDSSFTSKAIAVVDLKKSEPWDLPGSLRALSSTLFLLL